MLQVEVDLFELMCKVLDQNLFAQVDWARNSFYFKELKVGLEMETIWNYSQLSRVSRFHERFNYFPRLSACVSAPRCAPRGCVTLLHSQPTRARRADSKIFLPHP